MTVLEVNEFFVFREEVTYFKVCILHAARGNEFLVHFEQVGPCSGEVGYEFLLIAAFSCADDGCLGNSVEECFDTILELLLDPIPSAREKNEMLLGFTRTERSLKDEAVIDSPFLRKLLLIVAFRLDGVAFFDVGYIAPEGATIQLGDIVFNRKTVEICSMAPKAIVVQFAAFCVIDDLRRRHM